MILSRRVRDCDASSQIIYSFFFSFFGNWISLFRLLLVGFLFFHDMLCNCKKIELRDSFA